MLQNLAGNLNASAFLGQAPLESLCSSWTVLLPSSSLALSPRSMYPAVALVSWTRAMRLGRGIVSVKGLPSKPSPRGKEYLFHPEK